MSKEKQCECCHEWWYDSDVKEDLCPNCYDYFKQLKQQLEACQEARRFEAENHNESYKKLFEKWADEVKELKQQLAEKDEKIKRFMSMKNREQLIAENEALKDTIAIVLAQKRNVVQHKTQLAIQELEKVNGILTDTIIEVTQNEMDLNKFCYLEEISARFYEKMQEQIKELKGQHND